MIGSTLGGSGRFLGGCTGTLGSGPTSMCDGVGLIPSGGGTTAFVGEWAGRSVETGDGIGSIRCSCVARSVSACRTGSPAWRLGTVDVGGCVSR